MLGVTGEADAGAGFFAFVSVDHGLDVDAGAFEFGDFFDAAVLDGFVGFPTAERP